MKNNRLKSGVLVLVDLRRVLFLDADFFLRRTGDFLFMKSFYRKHTITAGIIPQTYKIIIS